MSDETLSVSSSQMRQKGAPTNRRQIKLQYKKINRICQEMDLARSRQIQDGTHAA